MALLTPILLHLSRFPTIESTVPPLLINLYEISFWFRVSRSLEEKCPTKHVLGVQQGEP